MKAQTEERALRSDHVMLCPLLLFLFFEDPPKKKRKKKEKSIHRAPQFLQLFYTIWLWDKYKLEVNGGKKNSLLSFPLGDYFLKTRQNFNLQLRVLQDSVSPRLTSSFLSRCRLMMVSDQALLRYWYKKQKIQRFCPAGVGMEEKFWFQRQEKYSINMCLYPPPPNFLYSHYLCVGHLKCTCLNLSLSLKSK